MLEPLKHEVWQANMRLPQHDLVKFTWGNVSAIDRNAGIVAIKPSGLRYEDLQPEQIVLVTLDGEPVEGELRPSSDTATHLALYQKFPVIGGICHTHSRWATIFAQAKESIPPLGTTHADDFYGTIPLTRPLTAAEIKGEYEHETGRAIIQAISNRDPMQIPAALVYTHGPFCWGATAGEAVNKAVILEEVAFMAWHTMRLEPHITDMQPQLLDKHYLRKHGKNSYYGQ